MGAENQQGSTFTGDRKIPHDDRNQKSASGRYDYVRFSELAGPLTEPAADKPYQVQYRSLVQDKRGRDRIRRLAVAGSALTAVLFIWLMWPSHWPDFTYVPFWLVALGVFMVVSVGAILLFNLISVISVSHATFAARNPIPVTPKKGTRVAFLTTIVPGKEPLEMVRRTLKAATRIRHEGTLHLWLLDEGNDPQVRALCAELGVRHFSRKGVPAWNQPSGAHRAKTKHGNYNSWLAAHGDDYEFFLSVDTDHVPQPNFAERMLGYFRDPDVAFVVGPQVYGNYDSLVTKAAESQQFLFHSFVQRAGNRYSSAMFVGTNNAVRIKALKAIGGLYDSITEDMATGLEFHSNVNADTGHRWKSVYTPDVLAVGEGPSSWTDFFSQQMRWSRGTYETLLTQFTHVAPKLGRGSRFNYAMLVTFYPMAALTWILAVLVAVVYMGLGASGIDAPYSTWMMLYADAAALQIALYVVNRRHNVSPHEPEGSAGVVGMLASALAAPIYATSLVSALLRKPSRFVVTPKGDSTSPDRLSTFRYHLISAGAFTAALALAIINGRAQVGMTLWALAALLLSLAPVILWWNAERRHRRTARPERTAAFHRPAEKAHA